MNKYSKETLDKLAKEHRNCIIMFYDGSVHAGILEKDIPEVPPSSYFLAPFSINTSGISFKRSHVKEIVLFNGLVYPKEDPSKARLKFLDLIELNDLVNKASYEFI